MSADTLTTFSFGGVDSSSIPELIVTRVRRPLVAARRDELISVPGHEGAWVFPEKAGMRTISVELDILTASYSARRAAVIALADLLDAPSGLARLIVSDEPDRFHRCRLTSTPDPDEWLLHSACVADFVAEPYSQALVPSAETFVATNGVAHAFAVADKVSGVPEIEIKAVGGGVSSLTLNLNGASLSYGVGALGLGGGQSLTASTLSYTVTRGVSTDTQLDGAFNTSSLDMSSVSGEFGFIAPGANVLLVSWTGSALTCSTTLRWRRRSR